ncbi:MAG: ATP-binding cassette domain-containing protein [Acidobacteria bacterium]|nr:ATP-binding cassette domain-containing protein [Acidobacteriota bacterium]
MSIVLEQLTKQYEGQTVVDRISLEVADREFFVLLGPSGCGKSTVLRMIAGLTQPDGGRILFNARDVTQLPPQQRNIGFVFQNYSVFRHMTVAENIEFGLKIRHKSSDERSRRREELLDLVGLTGLGYRYADELSGGQQQRVALARALAYNPGVLLLDEPFGALDVKTRALLRRSLKQIQRKLGVMTILVTHDQAEAFELADRIGVIERGRLLEVGPPETLYANPRNLFTATFVGAGNVLVGLSKEKKALFGSLALPFPEGFPHEDGAPIILLFRPEQVTISAEKSNDHLPLIGRGTIVEQNFTGTLRHVRLRLPRLHGTRQLAPVVPFGEEGLIVDAVVPEVEPIAESELWVGLRGWHFLQRPNPQILVFDAGIGSIAPLAVARRMADQMKASVTVLGVTNDQDFIQTLSSTIQQRQCEVGLTQTELRVHYGHPAEQIAIARNEELYDLIILAPRHRRSVVLDLQPRLVSGIVRKVINSTEVPVLVAKGERSRFAKLLISTTPDEQEKRTVRIGGWLARRLGASVTLLYIATEGKEPGHLVRANLERAESTLRALDVPVEVLIRQDQTTARGVLAEAKAGDYDLIVIGRREPISLSLFGIDDVPRQVLFRADRPVLVVSVKEN